MKTYRDIVKAMILGAAGLAVLIVITGAVTTQTPNMAGEDTESFGHVACSADGQIVYVVDVETVYRSTDGGENWKVVLKKRTGI